MSMYKHIQRNLLSQIHGTFQSEHNVYKSDSHFLWINAVKIACGTDLHVRSYIHNIYKFVELFERVYLRDY